MYKWTREQFETLTAEGSRLDLLDNWTTLEQRRYNAAHRTCPACQGQGYHVYKRHREVIRERVGCDVCLGTGAVSKSEEQLTEEIAQLAR